ncbi:MAG: SEC-C metal-binding domain-containing protein [Spirochaetia bacterium]|nr:SEC-C metal-binding domain-containing protein [Spirochaetota bacterium]MCX8096379.1 SEC-C metal-binding domain-containing protein [Spirochaetota bacterium]MDW8112955.1 SEC-C metal-binding domain-containing protein [Spirochaetia bacterium]
MGILEKIFGTKHERDIKKIRPFVEEVSKLEVEFDRLTNRELIEVANELRSKVRSSGRIGDDDLVKGTALVREASKRTLGMRHFDVQIIGGIVLFQGKIAEMKTGEGKTLVATIPLFVESLTGNNVQLVTVNDYLARRDAEWMGPIYLFLGATVGVINPNDKSYVVEWENIEKFNYAIENDIRAWPKGVFLDDILSEDKINKEAIDCFKVKLVNATKKDAYLCDITYGTNNEFGFDYLRDNMVYSLEDKVQRGHHYAIVDEVDSILIDEARTPLIISGPAVENTEIYITADSIVRKLTPAKVDEKGKPIPNTGDFVINEKEKNAYLTEEGMKKVEEMTSMKGLFSAIDTKSLMMVHAINQALRAHHLFKRDVDYSVVSGEIVIIDEFTGRYMYGRRWSDGLHQAIEAKERVPIKQEFRTLATITFQNYFRMYKKLAGMTGTAETEAEEFWKIYKLDVVVIPTHKPVVRKDANDKIFATEKEKFEAVVREIKELHKKGVPILVGTISVEKSEMLSRMLSKEKIPHNVLNAKNHEKEAKIIAEAGKKYAVTVATNMAGRGVDIKLGEGVRELGGLHVIGTERHEARRIDNQLRGRSGRQGDPGFTRFYVSFEDDLLRLFGSDRLKNLMSMMKWEYGQELEHPWLTSAIENAQKKVERYNFEIRRYLLEYDNVLNEQRNLIYSLRDKILSIVEIEKIVRKMISDYFFDIQEKDRANGSYLGVGGIVEIINNTFAFSVSEEFLNNLFKNTVKDDERFEKLSEVLYTGIRRRIGDNVSDRAFLEGVKFLLLNIIDMKWIEHLHKIEELREGITLRSYGERNPLVEFKLDAYEVFHNTMKEIREEFCFIFARMRVSVEEKVGDVGLISLDKLAIRHEEVGQFRAVNPFASVMNASQSQETIKTVKRPKPNDPCWCGSGRKYKKCHMEEDMKKDLESSGIIYVSRK